MHAGAPGEVERRPQLFEIAICQINTAQQLVIEDCPPAPSVVWVKRRVARKTEQPESGLQLFQQGVELQLANDATLDAAVVGGLTLFLLVASPEALDQQFGEVCCPGSERCLCLLCIRTY